MRMNLAAGTALAGSLLMSTFVWQSAQATNAPNLKPAVGNTGTITLVRNEGGGGGGGGGGRGNGGGGGGDGGHMANRGGDGGGGGDGGHMNRGGDGGHMARRDDGDRDMNGGGAHYRGGRSSGGDNSGGGNRRPDHDGKFARDHDNRHFSSRDRDHDHGNRHRVFRNGVWVWVGGTDYYAGGDCYWLLERAQYTDSPYWWSRYNACVGYY